jgi:tripartite-type tricarboxylate transporter receptor subunit TctC
MSLFARRLFALSLALFAAFAQAQTSKPIQIIVPVAAGGNIGVEFVAKAKPDGQTLLVSPATIATNVAVYRKL